MRRFLTRPFLTVLFALVAVLIPASASAAELRQGNSTLVPPGETIDDDLYVFGDTLDLQGTVNGDVVFFGGTSNIGGLITGDLLVMGGTTTVTGEVRGSIRATGGTVTIGGRVGHDVAVAAGTLQLGSSARVGRDLLAGAGAASVAAPIARNAFIGSGDLTLSAPVGGDVRAEGGTVRLAQGAAINGTLSYSSDKPAEIASGVMVGGGVERTEASYSRDLSAPLSGGAGLGALMWLRGLVGVFALGLVLIFLVPASTRRGATTLRTNLGASLAVGAGLLIGVPLLATLMFAFGLLIGGWWLGLVLICLYALALGVGYVTSSLLVGDWILERTLGRETHAAWSLLTGVVALGIVAIVPVIGGLAIGLALIAGLGAVGLAAFDSTRAQRGATAAPTAPAPVATAPAVA
jgi:hypothetical protein